MGRLPWQFLFECVSSTTHIKAKKGAGRVCWTKDLSASATCLTHHMHGGPLFQLPTCFKLQKKGSKMTGGIDARSRNEGKVAVASLVSDKGPFTT